MVHFGILAVIKEEGTLLAKTNPIPITTTIKKIRSNILFMVFFENDLFIIISTKNNLENKEIFRVLYKATK